MEQNSTRPTYVACKVAPDGQRMIDVDDLVRGPEIAERLVPAPARLFTNGGTGILGPER